MATASDNFDRANGTLGPNWTIYENMAGGGGQIVSQAFAPAQAFNWHEGAFWNATDFGEDQFSEGRRVTSGSYVAVAVRCSVGTSNRGYWYAWFDNGSVQKGVNGTVNTSLTTTATWAPGDKAQLRAVGNVLTFIKNNGTVGTFTDTGPALPAGGQPGLLVYNMGDGCRIDDWAGGDVGAPPTPPKRIVVSVSQRWPSVVSVSQRWPRAFVRSSWPAVTVEWKR